MAAQADAMVAANAELAERAAAFGVPSENQIWELQVMVPARPRMMVSWVMRGIRRHRAGRR